MVGAVTARDVEGGGRRTERGAASAGVDVPDGLYRVTTPYLCAGFVVEHGRVTRCAPIVRKRLAYWLTRAQRVA